jgi:hypothetical protein
MTVVTVDVPHLPENRQEIRNRGCFLAVFEKQPETTVTDCHLCGKWVIFYIYHKLKLVTV